MRKRRHPMSGTLYEDIGEGRVLVTRNGLSGTFSCDGRWLEGEVTQADFHMLVWVGGRELPTEAGVKQRGGKMMPEMVHD